ncbi:HelD family protein [Streptomyces beijiangensis]|uniref:ATP-binding domain-containing protein n=1 Tax=Streptomyces beijiangensis TaxID=163361 RepID=A0A939FCV6_9ACTN|nr:AAA family ATPase [Streptomyces beijiangensis]MBO0516745.1 ATP-binding domain-containing protein [Streptomyces beijiangensis]
MEDLDQERAYVDRCRAGLRRMLEGARENVIAGETVSADRFGAERLGRYLKSLAKEMGEEPDGPPFFGRLDFGSGEHQGRSLHIGRRHISGETGALPVVIDWRAPVSRVFYQASGRDPQGVAVRRRFGWSGPGTELTGFEDERLASGAETSSRLLAAEIERPRVGPMRDIVATIQPEQDDLVRAGLDESICVQGAPGTGKTAVGLHRAAFLLYSHRQRLRRAGVLVLGPNRAFLGYIAAVLPALGEVDVEQTTVEELLARGPVLGTDTEEVSVIKHGLGMAKALRTALYGRIGIPAEPVAVRDSSFVWRVDEDELRRIVDDTARAAVPYSVGRERVRSRIVALMQLQAEGRALSVNAAWLQRTGRAVTPFLDEVWPTVGPEQVLFELLCDPPKDLAALRWAKRPRSFRSAKWTAADAVLLDELAGLIERPGGFGHVIIDEAQDLSPMQCRAVARRSEHGSITVLGDLAQGTAPWSARSWTGQLELLGKPQAQVIALTTGFRVPAAVVELANRLLARLDVDVPATLSFRTDGRLNTVDVTDLDKAVVEAAREALGHEGSIGVLVPDSLTESVTAALRDAELPVGGERLTVMPVSMVKGLEYDHVIVAEPADIIEAETRGLNRLYVALTRAVSRLDILSSRDWMPRR